MANLHVVELSSTSQEPKLIIALLSGEPHTFTVSAIEYSLLLTLLKSICRTDKESSAHGMQVREIILRNLQNELESRERLRKSSGETEPQSLGQAEFRRSASL